ncbi:MAG: GNAT family N-acetyltransferase [Myxococcales bacterium]|nr:GNAT family N-acetyltransferase [Myxococcales bacterium]
MIAAVPSPTASDEVASPRGLTITVERTLEGLAAHAAAWEELAAHAADPNPFYEPYALRAALANVSPPQGIEVVLVWAPNPLPKQPAFLVGLFPLVRHTRYKGLPLTTLGTWKHLYAYLGTPLVRIERAAETIEAFLDWLRDDSGAQLFVWDTIGSDTAVRHALTDALNHRGLAAFQEERHTRAIFRPAASTEAYLDRSIPGKKRKELRRQERRLAEHGPVVFDDAGDPDAWIDEFLALEARGWKGQGGTALKDDPTARALFRAYCHGARARGTWMAMTLRLGGRPIAMKCNLRAGTGALAFKIAYDEEFARYSPGVLLELEHVRRLHEPGAPSWVDSGAAAHHPMINHLWRDRVGIETLITPTGPTIGALAVAALPLVRLARGAVRRLRSPQPAKP